MKATISLPDPLFRAADRRAAKLGISRSDLYQRALRLLLKEHEGADVTTRMNEVCARLGAANTLDSVLARLQAASLPREDW
jgi:metal-responsive CopG/Arc/MetJ family transcriptional regulator